MSERLYRIQKAAELTGVSQELIRAWERRYGVVSPERTDAGYRLYSNQDVAVLKRLKALTDGGLSISQAARTVPELLRELATERELSASAETSRDPSLVRWQVEILAAAERLDQVRIDEVLDEALSALTPLAAFDALIVPVLHEIGERWHAGQLGVAQEHLATQALRTRVLSLLHGAPAGGTRHVVVACFPEEQHEIGALGAALRFRYAGFRVTFLGQCTPVSELGAVVARCRPVLVGVSAVTDEGRSAFEAAAAELRNIIPEDTLVLLGGRAALMHRTVADRFGFRIFDRARWRGLVDGLSP